MNDIVQEPPPPIAKPAATLILFREQDDGSHPHILMVERSAKMVFAAGAAVFPGGRVDEADFEFARELSTGLDDDEAGARIGAIRETIEETGLAVALKGQVSGADVADARIALHAGESLASVCRNCGWEPDVFSLTPWARWRPPRNAARTYDTRFYIANAGTMRAHGKVDNTENSTLFWASAAQVLDRADRDELSIIFPTRRNLERLAQFSNFDDAREHALQYPVKLLMTFIEQRDDGKYLCLPEGYGYPVLEEHISSAMRG